MTVKAIETAYKGFRFRSRLEARWAVFFETLGMAWEYEKEGFDLDGVRYLPDFWVQDNGWLEVKPTITLRQDETEKVARFGDYCRTPGIDECFHILCGTPGLSGDGTSYKVLHAWNRTLTGDHGIKETRARWAECPGCHLIRLQGFNLNWSSDAATVYCENCDVFEGRQTWTETGEVWFHKGDVATTRPELILGSPRLMKAYDAARGARFDRKPSATEPIRFRCVLCSRYVDESTESEYGPSWCKWCRPKE